MGKWTEAEVDTLRENYRGHGSEWDGWDELLPGRSRGAICVKASDMGLRKDRGLYGGHRRGSWTEGEDAALAREYAGHGPSWEGWRELLPGRSPAAIRNRAQGMGLTRQPTGRWSADQDAYLLTQLQAIARRTGHSERQVVARAVRLARSAGVVLDA